MANPNWEYFLALESDLETTSRYVEFTQRNFSTYSVEFVKIFLASAAEAEIIAKTLCRKIDPTPSYNNMSQCRATITAKYSQFHTIEIKMPRLGLTFEPWKEWGSARRPIWWDAYTGVKHDRHANYEKANLENTLLSIAGLFSVLVCDYRYDVIKGIKRSYLEPLPRIMFIEGGPEIGWDGDDWHQLDKTVLR